MTWMNFDLEDGKPEVGFMLKPQDAARFVKFMQDCSAATADAERYQLLRRGQHWSVIDGIGDTLRADALDAAIDAARAPNVK